MHEYFKEFTPGTVPFGHPPQTFILKNIDLSIWVKQSSKIKDFFWNFSFIVTFSTKDH